MSRPETSAPNRKGRCNCSFLEPKNPSQRRLHIWTKRHSSLSFLGNNDIVSNRFHLSLSFLFILTSGFWGFFGFCFVFRIYFETVLIFQEKWRPVTLTLLLSDLEAPHESVSFANPVFPVGDQSRPPAGKFGCMGARCLLGLAGLRVSVLFHFESAQTRLCEISVGLLRESNMVK